LVEIVEGLFERLNPVVATALTTKHIENFKATATWHRHPANPRIFYSDGIKFLADSASCWWLVDDIVLTQIFSMISAIKFQIWILEKTGKKRAVLRCESEHGTVLFTKIIPYSEFPLPRVVIYCVDKQIMLASEY
jgi:hypothetical protein